MKIREEIALLGKDVIRHRRALHQIPEIGLATVETKAYLKKQLEQLKIDELREDFIEHGLVAVLYGKQNTEMIAFRADMDALPISEETKAAFVSSYPGRMHACGHDGHMAALLALITYLCAHKEALKQGIVFIFQPGEENPGGAKIMIENGLFRTYPIKAIFGTHVMPDLEKGKIATKAGPLMARVSELYFDILGNGAHAAMPHDGNDALLAGCAFVEQLQTIVSRSLDPSHSAVLTIGTMRAGEARNALAAKAHLEGTMRSFDDQDHERMKKRIHEIAKGIEQLHGVVIQVKIVDCYPLVHNDPQLYTLVKAVCADDFIEESPRMIAEDFSFYQQQTKGLFFYTGIKDADFHQPLHDPTFNFDELALLNTVETDVRILEELQILK